MIFKINSPKQGKLEASHLSPGERAGLREHGISEDSFDRMSEVEQREWKEELEVDAYQVMRKWKN